MKTTSTWPVAPVAALFLLTAVALGRSETVTLAEYFPLSANAEWLYSGLDWDGNPAKCRVRVDAVNASVTLYTGQSPATAYTTSGVVRASAYLDPATLVPYDDWLDYFLEGDSIGFLGSDDDSESMRVDGGLVFPAQMVVGTSFTNTGDAYLDGAFEGEMEMILAVIERSSLTLPGLYFPDVLHIRLGIAIPGDLQVHDEWWAKSVGMVKSQGVSGGGAPEHWELVNYSLPGEVITLPGSLAGQVIRYDFTPGSGESGLVTADGEDMYFGDIAESEPYSYEILSVASFKVTNYNPLNPTEEWSHLRFTLTNQNAGMVYDLDQGGSVMGHFSIHPPVEPVIELVRVQTNRFDLGIVSQPGQLIRVQASTNLTEWMSIDAFVSATNRWEETVETPPTARVGFIRACTPTQ